MTVAELIKQLQCLPQDTEVYVRETQESSESNPEAYDHYRGVRGSSCEDAPVNGWRRPFKKVVLL